MSTVTPGQGTVCVTGASGFIGSHIVACLLERGHTVRAAVRDPSNEAKTAHLKALPGAERLSFGRGDLMEPGSFDDAIAGCAAVVHAAAAVLLTAKDPQRDIVDPSVQGVANVLASAAKNDALRVWVQTSSTAAIAYSPHPDRAVNEDDWNDDASLARDPYGLAKVLAEKAVHAWGEDRAIRIAAINPSLVLGPVFTKAHCGASPALLRDTLGGVFPMLPRFHFGVVDVRDVALAHVLAVENDVSGRFLLAARTAWLADIGRELAALHPDLKVTTRTAPTPLMYLGALFDKRMDWAMLRALLNKEVRLDASRSRDVLGLTYRPFEETVAECAKSMLDPGWARTKPR